jgi:hypothetical protein
MNDIVVVHVPDGTQQLVANFGCIFFCVWQTLVEIAGEETEETHFG